MNIERAIKNYFATQKEILCVYLFGSTATGKDNKFSDVDVAVLFDSALPPKQYTQKKLTFMDNLSRILNRDVDIVVLNEASSFLKFQVIKQRVRIYERPNRREHTFEARTIMEYFDFLPIRRKLESVLINNIKGA